MMHHSKFSLAAFSTELLITTPASERQLIQPVLKKANSNLESLTVNVCFDGVFDVYLEDSNGEGRI